MPGGRRNLFQQSTTPDHRIRAERPDFANGGLCSALQHLRAEAGTIEARANDREAILTGHWGSGLSSRQPGVSGTPLQVGHGQRQELPPNATTPSSGSAEAPRGVCRQGLPSSW